MPQHDVDVNHNAELKKDSKTIYRIIALCKMQTKVKCKTVWLRGS